MTDITIISDTHMHHREIDLPGGDLLLHCGDMFNFRTPADEALADIDDWFATLPYRTIICIAGNHDFPTMPSQRMAKTFELRGIAYLRA